MRALDGLALAFESLRLQRLRTGLTVLAVAIGAASVLLLTAIGDGAKGYVTGQFARIGTNFVGIMAGRTETIGSGFGAGGATRPLTLGDAQALQRVPGAMVVLPVSLGTAPVAYGNRHRDVFVIGTTSNDLVARGARVAAGSFLPPGPLRRGEAVAVLGHGLWRELFGHANAVGTRVRIADRRFRVIGVMAPEGRVLGVDYDDLVFVPVARALAMFERSDLHRISIKARDVAGLPLVMEGARRVLRERHRDEDFTLFTPDAMLRSFHAIMNALTVGLALIAAISLAVAGIGIMNVMLIAVSERIGEVGLLKAIGAPPRRIVGLFLTEAGLLATLGAAAGIALAVIALRVAAARWPQVPLHASTAWAAAVLALALAVGLGFGSWPAGRAARLTASEALRRKA